MIPLTLEDALHPQEEDRYSLNMAHVDDRDYLRGVFAIAVANTPGAVVLSDMRVAWDAEGLYAHGADVMCVFNVVRRKNWSTFNVVLEGTRPALIVEITMPDTRINDLVDKVREYAEVGVPRYVIVDADANGSRTLTFVHYQLPEGSTEYEMMPISDNGRVWLPEVKLWLGAEEGRVVCFDHRGRRLGDYTEVTRQRDEEAESRLIAEQRADLAEHAITAEVETRMSAIRARQEAERRAFEEATARVAVETRLRALEAEVQRIKADRAE